MEINKITENKKRYLPLLLLADEQESMIDRYLEKGDMYALFDNGLKAVAVVVHNGGGVYEIKNLAVEPTFHRHGYGRKMIDFISGAYDFRRLTVGTGDSDLTIPFYESCGFRQFTRVKDFFTDNYDHPIIENGVLLKDMVYLEKRKG